MSLLTYNSLEEAVNAGVITADPSRINAASIDVTLGNHFKIERPLGDDEPERYVDLSKKECIELIDVEVFDESRMILSPGQFALAETRETFNLPDDTACLFILAAAKSSGARNGLELGRVGLNHVNAGWGDPGWHGSTLTLELYNITQYHCFALRPGMPIGQIILLKGDSVPDHASYRTKGQYNNQSKAQASKGIR